MVERPTVPATVMPAKTGQVRETSYCSDVKNLLAVEFCINEEKVRTAYRAFQLQRLACLPIGTFQTVDRTHNDMHRIQKH